MPAGCLASGIALAVNLLLLVAVLSMLQATPDRPAWRRWLGVGWHGDDSRTC
jgi:hypothetical protein